MDNIDFGKNIEFFIGLEDPKQLVDLASKLGSIRGVIVAGRSNVGKSSFINRLFSRKIAATSKTPGKTKKINIFRFEIKNNDGNTTDRKEYYYLFDLPGFGHAKIAKEKQKDWGELMESFFHWVLPFQVVLLVLQDARHPHTDVDQFFQQFIRPFSLTSFLVFNKIDKLKSQKERHALKTSLDEILKSYKKSKQVFYVSAEKGDGFKELALSLKREFAIGER